MGIPVHADEKSGSPPPVDISPRVPLALVRSAATVLPRAIVARFSAWVLRDLRQVHPGLFSNLAKLEPAVVHIVPIDLPYRFELKLGCEPFGFAIIDRNASGADAEISASVDTFINLVEGRIDSDTLFFRRDLKISGNTSTVVGLRNVLDREELNVAKLLAAPLGPLRKPARAVARFGDRFLDEMGARAAAMHRTFHLSTETDKRFTSDIDQCRSEIAGLTSRLARLEAQTNRRTGNHS